MLLKSEVFILGRHGLPTDTYNNDDNQKISLILPKLRCVPTHCKIPMGLQLSYKGPSVNFTTFRKYNEVKETLIDIFSTFSKYYDYFYIVHTEKQTKIKKFQVFLGKIQ